MIKTLIKEMVVVFIKGTPRSQRIRELERKIDKLEVVGRFVVDIFPQCPVFSFLILLLKMFSPDVLLYRCVVGYCFCQADNLARFCKTYLCC